MGADISREIRKYLLRKEFDDVVPQLDVKLYRSPVIDLATLVASTKFTRKEIKCLYRSFKQGCPTGFVDLVQFREIFAHIFPTGDASKYATFVFQSVRSPGKSKLYFEDFVIALSLLSRGSLETKLKWIFKLYDLNEDGYISRKELALLIRAIHDTIGKFADPQVDEFTIRFHVDFVFNKLDVDEDGRISEQDFMTACLKVARLPWRHLISSGGGGYELMLRQQHSSAAAKEESSRWEPQLFSSSIPGGGISSAVIRARHTLQDVAGINRYKFHFSPQRCSAVITNKMGLSSDRKKERAAATNYVEKQDKEMVGAVKKKGNMGSGSSGYYSSSSRPQSPLIVHKISAPFLQENLDHSSTSSTENRSIQRPKLSPVLLNDSSSSPNDQQTASFSLEKERHKNSSARLAASFRDASMPHLEAISPLSGESIDFEFAHALNQKLLQERAKKLGKHFTSYEYNLPRNASSVNRKFLTHSISVPENQTDLIVSPSDHGLEEKLDRIRLRYYRTLHALNNKRSNLEVLARSFSGLNMPSYSGILPQIGGTSGRSHSHFDFTGDSNIVRRDTFLIDHNGIDSSNSTVNQAPSIEGTASQNSASSRAQSREMRHKRNMRLISAKNKQSSTSSALQTNGDDQRFIHDASPLADQSQQSSVITTHNDRNEEFQKLGENIEVLKLYTPNSNDEHLLNNSTFKNQSDLQIEEVQNKITGEKDESPVDDSVDCDAQIGNSQSQINAGDGAEREELVDKTNLTSEANSNSPKIDDETKNCSMAVVTPRKSDVKSDSMLQLDTNSENVIENQNKLELNVIPQKMEENNVKEANILHQKDVETNNNDDVIEQLQSNKETVEEFDNLPISNNVSDGINSSDKDKNKASFNVGEIKDSQSAPPVDYSISENNAEIIKKRDDKPTDADNDSGDMTATAVNDDELIDGMSCDSSENDENLHNFENKTVLITEKSDQQTQKEFGFDDNSKTVAQKNENIENEMRTDASDEKLEKDSEEEIESPQTAALDRIESRRLSRIYANFDVKRDSIGSSKESEIRIRNVNNNNNNDNELEVNFLDNFNPVQPAQKLSRSTRKSVTFEGVDSNEAEELKVKQSSNSSAAPETAVLQNSSDLSVKRKFSQTFVADLDRLVDQYVTTALRDAVCSLLNDEIETVSVSRRQLSDNCKRQQISEIEAIVVDVITPKVVSIVLREWRKKIFYEAAQKFLRDSLDQMFEQYERLMTSRPS